MRLKGDGNVHFPLQRSRLIHPPLRNFRHQNTRRAPARTPVSKREVAAGPAGSGAGPGRRAHEAGAGAPADSDHSVDQAAYNLRRSLTELRKALGSEVYRLQSPEPHLLQFDLDNAEVDLTAFDAALERGDTASLKQAVVLYAGPLLWECTESWAAREREQRETAYLKTLEALSARAVADGVYEAAERWLRTPSPSILCATRLGAP